MPVDNPLTRSTSLPSYTAPQNSELRRSKSSGAILPPGEIKERAYSDLTKQEKMAVRRLALNAHVPKKTAHAALFQPSSLGDVNMNLGSKREHFTQDISKLQAHISGLEKDTIPGTRVSAQSVRANLETEQHTRGRAATELGDYSQRNDHYTDVRSQLNRTKSLTTATRIGRKLQAMTQPAREALTYRGMQAKQSMVQTAKQTVISARSALDTASQTIEKSLETVTKTADRMAHSAQKSVDDGLNLRGGTNLRHNQEEMLFHIATGIPLDSERPIDRETSIKPWIREATAQVHAGGRDGAKNISWSKTYPLLRQVAENQRAAREKNISLAQPVQAEAPTTRAQAPNLAADSHSPLARPSAIDQPRSPETAEAVPPEAAPQGAGGITSAGRSSNFDPAALRTGGETGGVPVGKSAVPGQKSGPDGPTSLVGGIAAWWSGTSAPDDGQKKDG